MCSVAQPSLSHTRSPETAVLLSGKVTHRRASDPPYRSRRCRLRRAYLARAIPASGRSSKPWSGVPGGSGEGVEATGGGVWPAPGRGCRPGLTYQRGSRATDRPHSIEPFSSCVAVGFDVVKHEDGLHDRGCAAWAAAQLGQDVPGLERGDRALTASADLRMRPVDGLLPA